MKKVLACILCAFTMCAASMMPVSAAETMSAEVPAAAVLCEVQDSAENYLTADAGLVLEAAAYDDDDEYEEDGGLGILSIPVGILAGVVIAFLVMCVLKGQLTSVKKQEQAKEYIKKGSFRLTDSRDVFLYKRITKIEKPKS